MPRGELVGDRMSTSDREAKQLVEASGLFDAAWYLTRYGDVAELAMDPVEHYLCYGAAEGRWPGPDFDPAQYLTQHPDVASTNINPLLHCIRHGTGKAAKPHEPSTESLSEVHIADILVVEASGLFDDVWYVAHYPDVAELGIDPIEHYLLFGAAEGRWPGPDFDPVGYVAQHPDVGSQNPLLHSIRHGASEGGKPGPTRKKSLTKQQTADRQLVESSGLLDPTWYLNRYPDVAELGIDPIEHYLLFGAAEGRLPGPDFDTAWYLAQNPDVAAGNFDPLLHYIRYGASEGREPRDPIQLTLRQTAARALATVINLEPELFMSSMSTDFNSLPVRSGQSRGPLYEALKALFETIELPYEQVIFASELRSLEADLKLVNSLSTLIENSAASPTLLVITDFDRVEMLNRLPTYVAVRVFSEYSHGLSWDFRSRLVTHLVHGLQPHAIFNINSRACWEALQSHGAALAILTEIYAVLHRNDYGAKSDISDRYLRTCFPYLKNVYVDNVEFARELIERHGIPPLLRNRILEQSDANHAF